jgi:hypothetical protein
VSWEGSQTGRSMGETPGLAIWVAFFGRSLVGKDFPNRIVTW